jgi:phenylpropionate dioxygenase-like ring-hydroxylating dioxygenase large terminal subunit
MGDPSRADSVPVFDLPQYHDPAWSAVEGDALRIQANYLNLADNLCDPAHVSFVHLSTLGNAASEDIPVHHEELESGLWDPDVRRRYLDGEGLAAGDQIEHDAGLAVAG